MNLLFILLISSAVCELSLPPSHDPSTFTTKEVLLSEANGEPFLSKANQMDSFDLHLNAPVPADQDSGLFGIVGYRVSLVDREKAELEQNSIYLHHFIAMNQVDRDFNACEGNDPTIFIASGAEFTPVELPYPHAYISPISVWFCNVDIVNTKGEDTEFYVKLEIDVLKSVKLAAGISPDSVTGKIPKKSMILPPYIPVRPFFYDVSNCDRGFEFDVPKNDMGDMKADDHHHMENMESFGGKSFVKRDFTTDHEISFPHELSLHNRYTYYIDFESYFDGTFVFLLGHLHRRGTVISLQRVNTGEILFSSRASYNELGWLVKMDSGFPMQKTLKHDVLRIVATYDNTNSVDGAMGIVFGFVDVLDNGKETIATTRKIIKKSSNGKSPNDDDGGLWNPDLLFQVLLLALSSIGFFIVGAGVTHLFHRYMDQSSYFNSNIAAAPEIEMDVEFDGSENAKDLNTDSDDFLNDTT